MKKLYVFLLAAIGILMPGKLWAQDKAYKPYFDFEGDNLVMHTDTEGAIIYYEMSVFAADANEDELYDIVDRMVVGQNSSIYTAPIPIKENVIIKAIATGQGLSNSDPTILIYNYTTWQKLLDAIEYGNNVFERAQNYPDINPQMLDELMWAIEEGQHMYRERGQMPDSHEAEHFTERIVSIAREIEGMMGQPGQPEPYAVLSDSNTVLTFYYDNLKQQRNGMSVGPFTFNNGSVNSGWYDQRGSITNVVFDASFSNCTTLTSTTYWFYSLLKLSSITGISNLKTDNVTNMSYMFVGCSSLTSLDLSNFKTDNVTNMSAMFNACSGLTSLDLSNFKTEKVTNMSHMFHGCYGLTSLDLSNFNTENVTDMKSMFTYCSSLTSLDLRGFNTKDVTNMGTMFYECSGLTTIYIGDGWSTASVTEGESMFGNCTNLVGGAGTRYDANHTDPSYAHIDGGPNNPGYFTGSGDAPWSGPEPYAVLSDNNAVLTFYYDEKKQERNGMSVGPFTYTYDGAKISDLIRPNWYDYREIITNALFDPSFANCTTLTSTSFWFYGCKNLTSIEGLNNLKTDNVTDMGFMFRGCSSLTSLDVSGFNTSKVEIFCGLFSACSSLTSVDISHFDTSNAWDLRLMFDNCSSLTELNVSNFKTDNVTDMGGMFEGCSKLTKLDLSNFNTEKVFGMGWMFCGCSSLTDLNISSLNTSSVGEMNAMFGDCTSLTSLDVSHFNTANVTIMNNMFDGCSSLTSFNVSNFITANVTNMEGMFANCNKLTSLDLLSFNTAKVENMTRMFERSNNLRTIFVGDNWSTTNVRESESMFNECASLIGGMGTHYSQNHTDASYAHIDGGTANPGYLTRSGEAPWTEDWYEPYVVLSRNNSVMTFYYDDQIEERGGIRLEDDKWEGWKRELYSSIVALVFDESFSDFVVNEAEDFNINLDGWTALAAIVAGNINIPAEEYEKVGNPNLLVYVNEPSLAPEGIQNVVINGVAQEIILTDVTSGNNNWYCPQEFIAEKISYARNFKQQTQVGISRGWESIALPFNVQTITHETQGQIIPFGAQGNGKRFWLRGYSENGLYSAPAIQANNPYIISMPNNTVVYYNEYNLNGRVTFAASNTVVPATPTAANMTITRGNISMAANYVLTEQSDLVYAINVGQPRDHYAEGSVFARGLRDVRPFEAYTIHTDVNGSRPNYIRIAPQDRNNSTGIETIKSDTAEGFWYSLDGRKMYSEPKSKGVYIQNGKKIIVR